MRPPSPIAVPNVTSIHAGWPINDKGVFYIWELDLHPGPNNALSLLTTFSSRHYVEEIVSDVVDHSLQGDFVVAKFDYPYADSYYYASFDIYFISPTNSGLIPANFDDAVASCRSMADDEALSSFPDGYSSFPSYTRRYIRCFVRPMPPPIPSKVPLPFPLNEKQSGWLINRDGDVFLNPLDDEKWTDEMRKRVPRYSFVMECVSVPHWHPDVPYRGKYDSFVWPWVHHSNVMPAGPTYPPGAIRFFVSARVEVINREEKFLRAPNEPPFRCPDADDDKSSPDEETQLPPGPEVSDTTTRRLGSSTTEEQGSSRAVEARPLDTIPSCPAPTSASSSSQAISSLASPCPFRRPQSDPQGSVLPPVNMTGAGNLRPLPSMGELLKEAYQPEKPIQDAGDRREYVSVRQLLQLVANIRPESPRGIDKFDVLLFRGVPPTPVERVSTTVDIEREVSRFLAGRQESIYLQIPVRIIAVNARGQCEYYGPYAIWQKHNPDALYSLRHIRNRESRNRMDYTLNPISFNAERPHLAVVERTKPFSVIPPPVRGQDLHPTEDPYLWIASPQWLERLVGPTSEISRSWEQTYQFVLTMVNTRILSPHTAILSYLSKHQDRIDSLRRNSQSVATEEYHRDTVEDIQRHIVEMRAILKYVTYVALDACAVLGGTEMPMWPLSPEAIGVFFDEPEISPEAVAFAMTLERWGVPHYRVEGGDPRVSISSSAGPLSNAADEAELQLRLRERAKAPSVRKPFSWPCTRFIPCMRDTTTPFFPVSGNIENLIREQVVQVLSSDLGTTSTFQVFSDTMRNILRGAWTGALYEEHMRSSTVGATWKCMRPPFAVGSHAPLIDAFMRVPYAYHHPNRPLPSHDASTPLVVSTSAAVHPTPTTTKEHWFVLSSRLSPDVTAILSDTPMLVRNGVLAYRDVRDRTVNTKNATFDGGNQQRQLLFKTTEARRNLELHLRSAVNSVNIITSTILNDYSPVGYTSFIELGYASEVFSYPFPAPILTSLLEMAPSPSPYTGPEPTLEQQAELFRRMFSTELFQYDRYAPLTSSSALEQEEVEMINIEFSFGVLDTICQRRPRGCSEADFLHLLRFKMVLNRLTRWRTSFLQHFYRSENPVYSRVLRYISNEIQRLVSEGAEGCAVETTRSIAARGGPTRHLFESISWRDGKRHVYVIRFEPGRVYPRNIPTPEDLQTHRAKVDEVCSSWIRQRMGKKAGRSSKG